MQGFSLWQGDATEAASGGALNHRAMHYDSWAPTSQAILQPSPP